MKSLNLLVLVVGILTFLFGLVGSPTYGTAYVVAGAILISGALIGLIIEISFQPPHKDEGKK